MIDPKVYMPGAAIRTGLAALAFLMIGGCATVPPLQRQNLPSITLEESSNAIRGDMSFLADDLLAGRSPGTQGYDLAARYVASRFRQVGLKSVGAGESYELPVPLLRYRATGAPSLTLQGPDGRRTELVHGADFGFSGWPVRREASLSAPLMFVGYGLVAPELGRDDYRNLNAAGKIVVVIGGVPEGLSDEAKTVYRNRDYKRSLAAKRGAVGMIEIASLRPEAPLEPTDPKETQNDLSSASIAPETPPQTEWKWSMTWTTPGGDSWFPGGDLVPIGRVDRSGADKLFAGSQVSLDSIYDAVRSEPGEIEGFDLQSVATLTLQTEVEAIPSANVVGFLEGTDPKLRDEVIVLSAHLDHLGVRETDAGTAISNGALDNASGVAAMLEVARLLRQTPVSRPILFLALTAEEAGLVGSQYFVRNPPIPAKSMIANLNIDMPILTYDFIDVFALGAERSTMDDSVKSAARKTGIAITPPPASQAALFTRSDHYRFVEIGIPSVFIRTGFGNGGQAATEGFLRSCYHKPCDDLSQDIDYTAAARYARLHYEIIREIANAPLPPNWTPGDFYGRHFGSNTDEP